MNRPTGVTILAVLIIISGTLSLCGGCFLLGFGSIAGPIGALFGGGQLGGGAFALSAALRRRRAGRVGHQLVDRGGDFAGGWLRHALA